MLRRFVCPLKMENCMTSDYFQTFLLEGNLVEIWCLLEGLSLHISSELDTLRMGSLAPVDIQTPFRAHWISGLLPKSLTSVGLSTAFVSYILPRPVTYMILYPGFRLVFGTLYPAYASYKAVRTKNVKEYVKWMMYWIVFALFTCAETFTDLFLSFWFPFYYELKIIIVIYLLSPATKGSSILYRKFVHPALIQREQEIDEYIARAKEQGYHTVLSLGSKGVNYATTILMQTAIKGGGGLVNHIRKSYSLTDIPGDPQLRMRLEDETDDTFSTDVNTRVPRRRRGTSSPSKVSSGSQVDLYFTEMDVRDSSAMSENFIPSHIRSSEDVSSGYVSPEPCELHQDTKERLVRSSSVSMANKVRTRASTRTERTSSMTEEADDEESDLGDESQRESQSPSTLSTSPTTGKAIDPIVRPHLQYLFSNLTEEQLLALVSSATYPGVQPPPIEPKPEELIEKFENKETRQPLLEIFETGSTELSRTSKEVPSKLLHSILSDETEETKKTEIIKTDMEIGKDSDSQGQSAAGGSDEEFGDCLESEAAESPSPLNLPAEIAKEGQNFLATEEARSAADPKTETTQAHVIRRPKKRQAPIPPLGGSLVDLSRLSQMSDQLEVSSLLDFDAVIRTPTTLKEASDREKLERIGKVRGKHDGESNISKMLQFPKLSFSFWQKSNKNSPSPTPDVSETPNAIGSHERSESFISLHGDESFRGSKELNKEASERFREMSQSPSSKRRSFAL